MKQISEEDSSKFFSKYKAKFKKEIRRLGKDIRGEIEHLLKENNYKEAKKRAQEFRDAVTFVLGYKQAKKLKSTFKKTLLKVLGACVDKYLKDPTAPVNHYLYNFTLELADPWESVIEKNVKKSLEFKTN